MPHDVIMPALGMAQETGVILSWRKRPGDAVATGEVLFEVETDKATMEVEALAAGFLSAVTAAEGAEVPVGQVIARITDTADEPAPAPADDAPATAEGSAESGALPEGRQIIMPTLGMAQDSGLLVGWLVEPGARVAADDPLFEVETDKSVAEVPAGADGYLAAQLAQPGDDVPTGQVIAIISPEPPSTTVVRGAGSAPAAPAAPAPAARAPAAKAKAPAVQKPRAPEPNAAPVAAADGRILASPKARRLAMEQGLDLALLVAAGHPQPYHVKDLEVLKTLRAAPAAVPAPAPAQAAASRHLTATIPSEGFSGFAAWAAETAGLGDPGALLAGLAGGCVETGRPMIVAHEAYGRRRLFEVPRGPLGAVTEISDGTPDLILRDLRLSRVTGIRLGAEDAPTLSLTASGDGLTLTLECEPDRLSAPAAVALVSDFAGRLEQPLRHLL